MRFPALVLILLLPVIGLSQPPGDNAVTPSFSMDNMHPLITSFDSLALKIVTGLAAMDTANDPAVMENLNLARQLRQGNLMIGNYLVAKQKLIPVYEDDLELYNQLLKSYLESDQSGTQKEILQFLNSDMTEKLYFPGAGAGSSNPLTTVKVKITVYSSDGTSELNGYSGFIKPRLSNLDKAITPLIPTNNSVKEITPGIKKVWIMKDGVLIKEREETIRRSLGQYPVNFIID